MLRGTDRTLVLIKDPIQSLAVTFWYASETPQFQPFQFDPELQKVILPIDRTDGPHSVLGLSRHKDLKLGSPNF